MHPDDSGTRDVESKAAAVRHAYELAAQIAERHERQAASPTEAAVAHSIAKELRWMQGSKKPRKEVP